jgi:hypothetical protein
MTIRQPVDPDRCIWRLLGRIETIAESVAYDDEEARQLIRDAIATFDDGIGAPSSAPVNAAREVR